jgi:sterol desaturase/sphingolipid hydroxylase (fatty acid hydroxylase superfamily)
VYAVGLGGWTEDAFDATGWLLVGLIQIVVLLAVIGPLQRWRAVEPVVDRHAIRIDVLYTLIHRLGPIPAGLFFTLQPFFDDAMGSLRMAGWGTFHLDEVWPGVTDVPVVAFAIYLVVLDFVGYWIHRGQHQFNWWWGLHSLHHSQRQMTMWSDDRNHLLDDIVHDTLIVIVAQLIGVAPGQFIAFVAFTQLSESLQHANLRLSFGASASGCGSARASTGCTTASGSAMSRTARARWAATTSACCCRGGTCCSAPPTSRPATTRPASATRSSPAPMAACATTAAASGRSSGWASSEWSVAVEQAPENPGRGVILAPSCACFSTPSGARSPTACCRA